MNRKLPDDLRPLASRYYLGGHKIKVQMARDLGIEPQSLANAFSQSGLREEFVPSPNDYNVEELPVEELEEPMRNPVIELPEIKLFDYKAKEPETCDEEVAVLHMSDGHAGKITESFNDDVYRERMEKVYRATMIIVDLHRHMYPIRSLYILNTGDNNQGENPFQGSVVGEVSMGARDQVKFLSAPTWNNVLGSFKEHFETVDMFTVPGNHGHDKLAPETSSYDLLMADILDAGIGSYEGINIHISEKWGAIVNIKGHRCFLFHGDGIMCQQGVPFFALDKKLKSWHMQYGGFRYAFSGHFHKAHYNEVSAVLEHYMCGSLVSDDAWALKKLGISSRPTQALYGIHPEHGITWKYTLDMRDPSSKQGLLFPETGIGEIDLEVTSEVGGSA